MSMRTAFDPERVLPRQVLATLTDLRVRAPQLILQAASRRHRRESLTGPDGRLVLLAADHPARMLLRIGEDPLAMTDRWSLLARIVSVLEQPDVDGVLGTSDIIDDLLLLDHIRQGEGQPALLDGRVLLGSMNRGGLAGTIFELDDRFTGYTAEGIAAMGLDGGKLLVRIDPEDPGTLRTLESASRAVDALAARNLSAFVEALPVRRVDGALQVSRRLEDVLRTVGVATGLGSTSRHLWLKLPYCDGYERVARATTCPIVLLGGEVEAPRTVLEEVAQGLAAGPTVRGVLMGRNVLFPTSVDPGAMALAVAEVVHRGTPPAAAVARLEAV